MNHTININLIRFGIPLCLLGILIFIMKSPFHAENGIMNLAITIDLLLIVPLLYFLLIRKTEIPKTTVVLVMIIGLLIGSYFLPKESQTYLTIFKIWILPIVELSILSFVIYNVCKVIKHYKLNKNESFDFFTTLKNTCYKILPKGTVIPLVTEIAVFYYGFVPGILSHSVVPCGPPWRKVVAPILYHPQAVMLAGQLDGLVAGWRAQSTI